MKILKYQIDSPCKMYNTVMQQVESVKSHQSPNKLDTVAYYQVFNEPGKIKSATSIDCCQTNDDQTWMLLAKHSDDSSCIIKIEYPWPGQYYFHFLITKFVNIFGNNYFPFHRFLTFSPLQFKVYGLWLAISITCSNLQQKNQWNITCVEGRIFLIIIFHVIQQAATKCKKISGHSGLLPLFCPFQYYIQLQSDATESSNCLIEILRFTPLIGVVSETSWETLSYKLIASHAN